MQSVLGSINLHLCQLYGFPSLLSTQLLWHLVCHRNFVQFCQLPYNFCQSTFSCWHSFTASFTYGNSLQEEQRTKLWKKKCHDTSLSCQNNKGQFLRQKKMTRTKKRQLRYDRREENSTSTVQQRKEKKIDAQNETVSGTVIAIFLFLVCLTM